MEWLLKRAACKHQDTLIFLPVSIFMRRVVCLLTFSQAFILFIDLVDLRKTFQLHIGVPRRPHLIIPDKTTYRIRTIRILNHATWPRNCRPQAPPRDSIPRSPYNLPIKSSSLARIHMTVERKLR